MRAGTRSSTRVCTGAIIRLSSWAARLDTTLRPGFSRANMKLDGRIALVTGASRGLGRGIAEALAAEGAAVAVNYRSGADAANEVVAGIEASGGRAVALQGDVSEHGDAERVVAQTVEQLGGLSILVNNAGIARDRLISSMEVDDWLDVMKV